MSLSQGLVLKHAQTLVMTPQVLQAVKILQLSSEDLLEFMEDEAQKNPFLTLTRPSPRHDFEQFSNLAQPLTLQEHVAAQLMPQLFTAQDKAIGAHLIASLDEAGYLTHSFEEMPYDRDDLEAILPLLQACSPVGVGARTLQECLTLQVQAKNRFDPMMAVFIANLPLVAAKDFKALQKLTHASPEDIVEMMREVKALNPKPGLAFEPASLAPAQPDILLTRTRNGELKLELNSDVLPRLLINESYATSLTRLKMNESDKVFIKENLAQGHFLHKALMQRYETLLRVAGEILVQQEDFFKNGTLKPMTLMMVAEKLDLHESTISRAVSHKSMLTPRGLFELKYFFTTALAGDVSAETVKNRIKTLIENEQKVLSDDDLVSVLKEEGYILARRTVAKYREGLGISSSVLRRRAKNFD